MDIITDVDALHRISEKADSNEINNIISELRESIPEEALGLAAIQIGIPRRIFIANIPSASYTFVNPEITWTSVDRVPSIEGCLSLPGVSRCIERHSQIEIVSESIDGQKLPAERFTGQSAMVIQHEYDHINGVLITDYAEIKNAEQKSAERNKNREQRIAASRALKHKKEPKAKTNKISVKKKARLQRQAKKKKRADRTARRQAKIRVEIEERYKADQKNLFNNELNTA